ncbi:type VI secretion system tip protein VgrG [Denitrobaculum tricleocarpae]|uniref:type VI secretion system Vgr family protein n=1 Tax=Denitrobaculum tricleocarpae TaxID=2591009 RepID=UPI0015D43B98|nr:type VI secretion system tip protein VgrG [Denitrobaculum tricleocarpae]
MAWEQTGRLLTIESPLGQDVLLLSGLEGEERSSRLFRFDLDLLSETAEVDPKDLLGKSVSFSVKMPDRDGEVRWFNGIVKRFASGGAAGQGLYSYRIEVVPEFWLLTRTSDCRIFQEKTVDKIIEDVFSDASFSDYEIRANASFPTLEYCVQFNESDFNFVSRLMERFGLFYFHKHEQGKHTLVIADNASAYEDALQAEVEHRAGGVSGGVVNSWNPSHEFKSGTWVQSDYNFTTSKTDLESKTNTVIDNADFKKYEVYEYPGQFTTKAEGSTSSELRMETEEASYKVVEGQGDCCSFSPGHSFKLTRHETEAEVDQEYVVSGLTHHAYDPTFLAAGGGETASYANRFVALPKDIVLRPEKITPVPRPNGPQSAVVVGPAGEEIDVDEHGRVHVQFHWDRYGEDDDKSSCYLRVTQMWAGKNWGSVFTPRVGMEVIVSFLDGDYDRPLVTGCVYNDENTPPYSLPANKTQSGIKTRSSKSGAEADFNELRFEDKAGKEEVYFHAQKDFMRKVENDDTLEVDNDQSITVTNNRTLEVSKGNEDITISQGNRTATISKGNEKLSVKMGNIAVKADAGKITVEAMQSIELKVGGNSIKIDQSGIKIKGMMVTVQGDMKADLKSPMTTVEGSGMLTVKGGIVMIN